MSRELIRAPVHDRNRSLGWLATAWTEHFTVHGPGDVQDQPVTLDDELTEFVVDFYAHDPSGEGFTTARFSAAPRAATSPGRHPGYGSIGRADHSLAWIRNAMAGTGVLRRQRHGWEA